MRHSRIAVASAVVLIAQLARARADANCVFQAGPALVITAQNKKPVVVTVTLTNPPISRARVIFQRDSYQHELEWDPAIAPRLAQSFIAEAADVDSTWNASAVVDPSYPKQGVVGAMLFAEAAEHHAGKLVANLVLSNPNTDKPATTKWPSPTWSVTCAPLPSIDKTTYSPVAGAPTSGARGLSTIPEPVAQTLALLGQIAIERAKAGAMEVLKERFVTPLCGDDDPSRGVKLSDVKLDGGTLAFPQSCALLKQLRIEDVLASGKPLLLALRDDVRETIAPSAIRTFAGEAAWGSIATGALAIVNRAIDRGSFSVLDAEAGLDLLLDAVPVMHSLPLVDPELRKALVNALALIDECKKTADAVQCAKDLVASADADAIEGKLSQTAKLAANDMLDALRQLDALIGQLAKVQVLSDALSCADSDEAKRASCLRSIVRSWDRLSDGFRTLEVKVKDPAKRDDLVKQLVKESIPIVVKYAEEHVGARRADDLRRIVGVACTGRLAIGIVRRCSNEGCTNDRIRSMFEAPEQSFGKGDTLADDICWIDNDHYRLARDQLPAFEAFVADGLELLAVAAKQTSNARAVAVVKMLAHVAGDAAGCTGAAAGSDRCRELSTTSDLLVALLEEDHAKAIAAVTTLVQLVAVKVPPALTKGVQLVGTVAAYAQVYEDTKALDPAAAAAARKKALQSLIDAATDRHGRGGSWIVSLGSNVGASATWSYPRSSQYNDAWAPSPQVRVPIGFSLDLLPQKSGHPFGFHSSLIVGDLGQFAALSGGALDNVRWDSFLSPGVEVGVLFGSPEHAVNLTFHAEYAPALFTDSNNVSGAARIGVSLGYYVPFFDFN